MRTPVYLINVTNALTKDITQPTLQTDTQFATSAHKDCIETKQSIGTVVASIHTREIERDPEHVVVPRIHIPSDYKIDVTPFINRPFFLQSLNWSTLEPQYTLLAAGAYKLPADIIRSNPSLLAAMKIGSLYRMAGSLHISVAGTITHAGCLLVGIIPPLTTDINYNISQPTLVNTILSGPHKFLFANEATSVSIELPWYCNTDLDSLDVDNSGWLTSTELNFGPANCGTFVCMVLNPLQPSTGSTTSLSVVVEANLCNLELYVPTPRIVTYAPQSYFTNLGTGLLDSAAGYAKTLAGDAIDGLRKGVRYYTGLHNPNIPAQSNSMYVQPRNRLNNVDAPSFLEHLDPNVNAVRTVEEPIFNTEMDEMAISHICAKRQYIGTAAVLQSDPTGKLIFCRPISPFQGGMIASQGILNPPGAIANNIELLHLLSRAWSGSLKLVIQSVMNNKQQVKLRVIKMYNLSSNCLNGQPVYQDILQAPCDLLEFTAGGQEHEIELPYLARNRMTLCSREQNAEALLHGVYYIYVAQPMANSSDSPTSIFFNMYIKAGDDFKFYGYSTELVRTFGPFSTGGLEPPSVSMGIELQDTIQEEEKSIEYQSQSMEVMNKPQNQEDESRTGIHLATDNRLLPLVDVRPFIRRLYPLSTIDVNTTTQPQLLIYDVGEIIGELTAQYQTPATAVSRMYYGKHAGIKMRLRIQLSTGITPFLRTKIFFAPTQHFVRTTPTGARIHASQVAYSSGYNLVTEQFPLNNVTVSLPDPNHYVYEFTIPNTSPFKFIGSPHKMMLTDTAVPTAAGDLGNIVVSIQSPSAYSMKVYAEAAFTDESRLGFHSIAPLVTRPVANDRLITPGVGAINDDGLFPGWAGNGFLYTTRR